MNKQLSRSAFATLTIGGAFFGAFPVMAQVAGVTTTVDATVTESIEIATGWSVRKSLLGKTIYDGAGQKVGKVEDLIISTDRNVSYIIVGAGGFVGIGRHDVAVPVKQIEDHAGKLVMASATKDTIKAMPAFVYFNDSATRDQFLTAADKDIASGKAKVAVLEKKAGAATTDAKAEIDRQITALQGEVASAETKLNEMKQVSAARWKEFEAGVSAATARLRKAIDTAVG